MAENSKIEWTHHTFNPWRGCAKVSDGCKHCYAETMSKRNPGTLGVWGPNGSRVVASEAQWRLPRKWNREAEAAGERRRVFCASLADVFEDWGGPVVDSQGHYLGLAGDEYKPWSGSIENSPYRIVRMDDVRLRLFALIDATPNLDWLLLTKRPENIRPMMDRLSNGTFERDWTLDWHMKNIWLGTSVENQAAADERIPHLLRVPAAVRFLSCEPLLGPVSLWLPCEYHAPVADGPPEDCGACDGFGRSPLSEGGSGLDWVIVGGESGPKARPCDVAWIRSMRDQCKAAGVACFIKQLGAKPNEATCGDATTIRLRGPKGDDWSEWPESLRVREFPQSGTNK